MTRVPSGHIGRSKQFSELFKTLESLNQELSRGQIIKPLDLDSSVVFIMRKPECQEE